MGASVGDIDLDLHVNQNGFNRAMSGIQSLAMKAGKALAAAFAVKSLVQFGAQCLELGSDLAEVQNVVDVTFPGMTAQVDKFAQSAAASFGLSETMAKQFTGTFGAMAKSFGFSEKSAYNMSTALTGLAGDVASFYDISQDEAYTKLKSVFTGETETLKDLGVVMTQSALDAYALANGYGKTTKSMSEAEKVALRYAFVQDQLSQAQGDFLRTSDSWANQVRLLKLQFDSLKASIGQGLIAVLKPVIKTLNTLLGKINQVVSAFSKLVQKLTGKKKETTTSTATAEADALTDSLTGAGTAADKTAKKIKNALYGFDELNVVPIVDDSSDSGSGVPDIGGAGTTLEIPVAEEEGEISELEDRFTQFLENIKNKVQPTVDALRRLWDEGLAKLNNFTGTALSDFYHNFLVPIGSWTLGEGLPRFIDALNGGLSGIDFDQINNSLNGLWNALSPFTVNVGEGLLWLWKNVLVPYGTWVANEVVPRFFDSLSTAVEACNTILEALEPLFQWFWDSVLQPIAEWTGGIFLTIWDGINEALQTFSEWCEGLSPKIQGFVDGLKDLHTWASENETTLGLMAIILGGLALAITANVLASNALSISAGITSIAIGVYNGVTAVAAAVTGAFGAVLSFLTSPITLVILAITALIAVGYLLYKNWDVISEMAKEAWDYIKEKFQAFDKWLSGVFAKDWSKSFGGFGEILNGFFKNVSNIWNAIKKIFRGIVDFISGVFSGDWKKAWNGVKDIFKGMWDLMVSVVKAPINLIIGAINGLIRGVVDGINAVTDALNGLSFDIPDWVPVFGGKTFGFNIGKLTAPQIPYLAEGGYVKPNTPQLAMIGDNRHQGEVVAPDDKIYEITSRAVSDALKMMFQAQQGQSQQTPIEVNLYASADLAPFFRQIKIATDKENERIGKDFRMVTV